MSLLLDAIKKAEQRKQEQLADGELPVTANAAENNLVEVQPVDQIDLAIDAELLEEPELPVTTKDDAPQHELANPQKAVEAPLQLATEASLDLSLEVDEDSDPDFPQDAADANTQTNLDSTAKTLTAINAELTPADAADPENDTNPVEPVVVEPVVTEPVAVEPVVKELPTHLDQSLPDSGLQLGEPSAPVAAPVIATIPPQSRFTLVNLALLLLIALVGVGAFYYLAGQQPTVTSHADQFANNPNRANFENFQQTTPTEANSVVFAANLTETGADELTPGPVTNPVRLNTAPIIEPPVNDPTDPNDRIDPGFAPASDAEFSPPSSGQNLIIRRVVASDRSAIKKRAENALQQGDLAAAQQSYQQWLDQQPSSTGARFGLAKVALLDGNTSTARLLYLDILQIDPNNAAAQASLLNLPGLASAESLRRLQSLVNQHPDDAYLNYVMGNQHVRAGRWRQAQQHYFRATSAQREHAVYAFNLAIALDHLTQPRAAADYYRRALAVNSPPLDEPTRQQASDRLTQLNTASN